jgi:hypothetical protein
MMSIANTFDFHNVVHHQRRQLRCLTCGFLLLIVGGFVNAAVDDPIDNWAMVDIRRIEAQIDNGVLKINVETRNPLQDYSDHGWPVIEVFVDGDRDPSTGDYRHGSVEGIDFIIECTGNYVSCTLHRLPRAVTEEIESIHFSLIQDASVTLQNSTTMTIQLPLDPVGGNDSVDVFAVAYFEGNNPILDQRILLGNGDRCPNVGAVDTITGDLVVRQHGEPVDVVMNVAPNNPQAAYEIVGSRFRTLGDQFEITLNFDQSIDLASFVALRGGIVIDSDRSLETGQIVMTQPEGLGLEIPSWGGDVILSFWLDDQETIMSFRLIYETNGGTLFSVSIPFGSPCEQDIYPSTGILACNDGGWHVQDNKLIMSGSLSILDSMEQIIELSTKSSEFTRYSADGHMILRTYTVDEETGEKDVTPDMGRVWDTSNGEIIEPLFWNSKQKISMQDPAEYGLVWGYDLVRVDAQIIEDNLVIKGVLSLWSDVDPNAYFEILLDTDMNILTGERVENQLEPGQPAIGADYQLTVYVVADGQAFYRFTELVRPDQKVERHDAFLFAEPNSLISPDEEDSFTVTIPLSSLGSPDMLAFFVATRRWGYVISDRYDIAPPEPVSLIVESDADSDGLSDDLDNCIMIANGPVVSDAGGNIQLDSDGDGYGNICDPDFNNNGVVDPFDFSLLKSVFGSSGAPAQDLNGNGVVDPSDFSMLKVMFGQPPGPSCCGSN